MFEYELYEGMVSWLKDYLQTKYPNYTITCVDSHSNRLDQVLTNCGVTIEVANGIDIQIDVLGIAMKGQDVRVFFIEAKRTQLTLRDLGQLWAYCKLINPEEAFLFSSSGLGSLNRILNHFRREDLLDFGDGKYIKKMKVGIWNINSGSPYTESLIPKM